MKQHIVMTKVIDNIEQVIIGKRELIENMVIALACNSHVLLEDVPGVGKTTVVAALAKSIAASFKRIQFTPDVMPSDITGFSMYNPQKQEFEYHIGTLMSQIILADEINRTPPKTQSSLLEAMEERQVTVDGNTYKLSNPFIVFATQNPIEHLGTYPLPEAQMDRFIMKLSIGYPNLIQEQQILTTYDKESPLDNLKPVTHVNNIVYLQKEVKQVYVNEEIKRYIVELVSQTRNHHDILIGSSPRGSLFLMMASKAWAYYQGRNYVKPDDVLKMFVPVISHRITIKQELKLKNITTKQLLINIMTNTKVPTGV